MRKTLTIVLTILFSALPLAAQTSLVHGLSVAPDRQVLFAPGNLQYNAMAGTHLCADGTTKKGAWRFAANQWDYIALDPRMYSSDYDGWIDLFAWGTSGWNSGAMEYQPWARSTDEKDYYVGGNVSNSLTGACKYADWAVYNTIGSDPSETWRTLTNDEWEYLLDKRNNASGLCGKATVGNVCGMVFLPDDFYDNAASLPPFVSGKNRGGYGANTYTVSEWMALESVGAVFLPAASVSSIGANEVGYYWSTSFVDSGTFSDVGVLQISKEKNLTLILPTHRAGKRSVRPVWDIPAGYVPAVSVDTVVCDTLMPVVWHGHEWRTQGEINDTLKDVSGRDSICLNLRLSLEICCPEVQVIQRDTVVCDTLLPFTWTIDGQSFVFERAETQDLDIVHSKWTDCIGRTYSIRLDTVHCEHFYDFIVNKYNWQLLCNNVRVRELFPDLTVFAYQWYKSGVVIPEAIGDDYAEQTELQGDFQLRLHMSNGQYIWSEILTIEPERTSAPGSVRIYNRFGSLVYQSEETTVLPSLSCGLYIVRIERNGEIFVEKKMIP